MPYVGRAPSAVPVTADDIPANSIDASKIVDGSIELAEIADNSITDAKLNSSKLDGIETGATNYTHPTTHATADIADNAITEAKIADAAVVSLKSGRKNLIINGGFDVWQRGTSQTGGGYQSVDRMKFSSGMQSVSKGSDLANGFANVLEVTLSETTGWVYPTLYIIEGGTMLPNKTYTFSYYGKASQNITGMHGHFYTNVGQITTGISASFTTSWVKYSYTFTMPSTYNGTFSIYLLNHNTTGTGGITFSIANMQMEEGSVATDFEHRSYGEELALCQRYYQSSFKTGNVPGVSTDVLDAIHVVSWGDGNCMGFPFQGGMRASPTVVLRAQGSTTVGQVSSSGTARTASALNTGDKQVSFLQVISGTANTYNRFTWTADAEL